MGFIPWHLSLFSAQPATVYSAKWHAAVNTAVRSARAAAAAALSWAETRTSSRCCCRFAAPQVDFGAKRRHLCRHLPKKGNVGGRSARKGRAAMSHCGQTMCWICAVGLPQAWRERNRHKLFDWPTFCVYLSCHWAGGGSGVWKKTCPHT